MKEIDRQERPRDRMYRRAQKAPARVVNMKLELELVAEIEVIAADQERDFHNTVDMLLSWAAYSCDRRPYFEMMAEPGGFTAWSARIRARHEAKQLEDLYGRDAQR